MYKIIFSLGKNSTIENIELVKGFFHNSGLKCWDGVKNNKTSQEKLIFVLCRTRNELNLVQTVIKQYHQKSFLQVTNGIVTHIVHIESGIRVLLGHLKETNSLSDDNFLDLASFRYYNLTPKQYHDGFNNGNDAS